MVNSCSTELVASCVPIEMQHATNSPFHATNSAMNNATGSLKALACAVLERNSQSNTNTLDTQKPMQLFTPKCIKSVAQKLHGVLTDKQKILAWLSHIGETDPELIDEVLDKCSNNPEVLTYYLGRAKDVPVKLIQCSGCQHFKSHNPHGRGSGTCNENVTLLGICNWSETQHTCNEFKA
jgi:hypothetical protein